MRFFSQVHNPLVLQIPFLGPVFFGTREKPTPKKPLAERVPAVSIRDQELVVICHVTSLSHLQDCDFMIWISTKSLKAAAVSRSHPPGPPTEYTPKGTFHQQFMFGNFFSFVGGLGKFFKMLWYFPKMRGPDHDQRVQYVIVYISCVWYLFRVNKDRKGSWNRPFAKRTGVSQQNQGTWLCKCS